MIVWIIIVVGAGLMWKYLVPAEGDAKAIEAEVEKARARAMLWMMR